MQFAESSKSINHTSAYTAKNDLASLKFVQQKVQNLENVFQNAKENKNELVTTNSESLHSLFGLLTWKTGFTVAEEMDPDKHFGIWTVHVFDPCLRFQYVLSTRLSVFGHHLSTSFCWRCFAKVVSSICAPLNAAYRRRGTGMRCVTTLENSTSCSLWIPIRRRQPDTTDATTWPTHWLDLIC